jgi:hypothetical protein
MKKPKVYLNEIDRLTDEVRTNRLDEGKSSFVLFFISFGCALAITISYESNKSIGSAISHGLASWFYVLYFYNEQLRNK